MNFKNFKIEILVEDGSKGVLSWSADDLKDAKGLLVGLENELDNIAFMQDWKVVEDPHSPFWGKSPVHLLHKLPGQFGSGAKGQLLDKDRLKGWVNESQIILIGQERDLPRHHVQLLQWWAFNVGSDDPVGFVRNANPEKLLNEFFDDQKWMEGVRDREDF